MYNERGGVGDLETCEIVFSSLWWVMCAICCGASTYCDTNTCIVRTSVRTELGLEFVRDQVFFAHLCRSVTAKMVSMSYCVNIMQGCHIIN